MLLWLNAFVCFVFGVLCDAVWCVLLCVACVCECCRFNCVCVCLSVMCDVMLYELSCVWSVNGCCPFLWFVGFLCVCDCILCLLVLSVV